MKTNLLNEINDIRFMFGYRPGKVISEQKTNNLILENEDADLLKKACSKWNSLDENDQKTFVTYTDGKTEGNPFGMPLACQSINQEDSTNMSPLSDWQKKLMNALISDEYKN